MTPLRAVLAAVCFALTGCSTVEYYAQAIRGHLELTASQRPIDEVLADPSTAPELAEQLRGVSAMREFAVSELALPDNGSYRSYAALNRDYVVYSVVAAPALSLEPVRSCFPVVGCVSYRGYYRLADANRAADRLRQRWFNTHGGPKIRTRPGNVHVNNSARQVARGYSRPDGQPLPLQRVAASDGQETRFFEGICRCKLL